MFEVSFDPDVTIVLIFLSALTTFNGFGLFETRLFSSWQVPLFYRRCCIGDKGHRCRGDPCLTPVDSLESTHFLQRCIEMKVSKMSLFFILGLVVLTGIVWFFQRGTPSQETTKVYEPTPGAIPSEGQGQLSTGVSSETGSQTTAHGKPHSHAEGSPHTHSHERPSDSMVRIAREALRQNPDWELQARWVAYVESEEGRAFFDGFPSADEWYEKSKSFGFFQETPGLLAARERHYREHFPTGTVDENEPIIREMMKDAILDQGLHEEEYSRRRNHSVVTELITDMKFSAWVSRKLGSEPPSVFQEWINSTFEEVRLAEREKYLAPDQNGVPDTTDPAPPQADIAPEDGNPTSANPRSLPGDTLTVEENPSDTATPQPAGSAQLPPTGPVSLEPQTYKSLETALRSQFSPDRFNAALKTLTRYGPQEGLRRLKSSDPAVAKQVERLISKPEGED